MAEYKTTSIAVPKDCQYDFDDMKDEVRQVLDMAKIANKKLGDKKHPETFAELILLGVPGVCAKIRSKLEGKVSKEELESQEERRKYLREYYSDYPKKKSKK